MRGHHEDSELYGAASFNERARGGSSVKYPPPSIDIDHPFMDFQDTPGKWIQVYSGDLVPVVLQLFKSPTLRPIEGGKDGEDSSPLYVARSVSSNGCYPGECGFHISGARTPRDGVNCLEPKFEILLVNPADYEWRPVVGPFNISKIDNMQPVLGGHYHRDGIMKDLYIARAATEDGGIHFGNVSDDSCGMRAYPILTLGVNTQKPIVASICYQELVQEIERFEVLVHANSNVHGVKILMGRCSVGSDCTLTKAAARYPAAVNFERPFVNVPRVAVGLSKIDAGLTNTSCIRVESFASSIRRDRFKWHGVSWADGMLHWAEVDWMAIVDQPTWRMGVFKSSNYMVQKWGLEERVTFDEPFSDGAPVIFACLSGIEMVGKWSVRMYTTEVDHTGFTVGIANNGEEGGLSGNLISAAVTWIAIPGTESVRKKNVWIGKFSTDMGSPFDLDKCDPGVWRGNVDFGIEFRNAPKIFVGFRQICCSNDRNLRVHASTSNVTTSGMDWELGKWWDTKLLSAGANFLAIDA